MTNSDQLRLAIWQRIGSMHLSVSHDSTHIDRVEGFARHLTGLYGGDPEVVVGAAILHDLGRAEADRRHGLESISASVEQARGVLQTLNSIQLPDATIEQILLAINEHDQPDVSPSTVEGKILKDADFLAGFGAWGILRVAMWSGETDRPPVTVRSKIGIGMWKRFQSLEFPESRRIAQRELAFADMFLSELGRDPVAPEQLPGKYIVLEGISGTGKDTQAARLTQALAESGVDALIVHEPGQAYRGYKEAFQKRSDKELANPRVMRHLFAADRAELFAGTITPALRDGLMVVSVRSYLSTMIYQCDTPAAAAGIAFDQGEFPQPDVLVLLDVEPSVALLRVEQRSKQPGLYESIGMLTQHRTRYLELTERYFPTLRHVVDATGDVEHVASLVWQAVAPVVAPSGAAED